MKLKLPKSVPVTLSKKLTVKWKINSTVTTLTRKVEHSSYIDALIFISKVIVHAEVRQISPTITLEPHTVKVIISAQNPSRGLSKDDYSFASLVDDLTKTGVVH